MKIMSYRGSTTTITKDASKMFLKKVTLRILYSDIFLCNFPIFKQEPPNFSFQLSREKSLSRILPILSKLVGKISVGVLEDWKHGMSECWSDGAVRIRLQFYPSF